MGRKKDAFEEADRASVGSIDTIASGSDVEIEITYVAPKFRGKKSTYNPELDLMLTGLQLDPLPAGNHVFSARPLEGEQPEVSSIPHLTLAPPQRLPPLSLPVNYLRPEDTGETGNHYPYTQVLTKLSRPHNIVKFDLPPPITRTPWLPLQRFPLSRPAKMAPPRDVNYLRCGRPVVAESLQDYNNNNMFGYRRGVFTGMAPQRFVSPMQPAGDVACPRYSLPQVHAIQDHTIPSIVSFL